MLYGSVANCPTLLEPHCVLTPTRLPTVQKGPIQPLTWRHYKSGSPLSTPSLRCSTLRFEAVYQIFSNHMTNNFKQMMRYGSSFGKNFPDFIMYLERFGTRRRLLYNLSWNSLCMKMEARRRCFSFTRRQGNVPVHWASTILSVRMPVKPCRRLTSN